MKTKRITYTLLLLLITAGVLTSCVKDDDFDIPQVTINPPQIDGDTISIEGVKAMLMQEAGVSGLNDLGGDEQLTFQDSHLYMTGYVISSDESGNFYQQIVLQDKSKNPTSGIKIMIQANPLYTKYEIGRKVYVELDGFTVGFSNGVIALGSAVSGSDFVDKAPESFEDKIIRTPVKDSIIPLPLSISDFSRQYDCLFIHLDSVEVASNYVGKTFAAEPGEQYDATRTLESCTGGTTSLSTSTFADFKAMTLPSKMGSLDAILSKTFNGSAYVVKVNYPSDIHFDKDRCNGSGGGTTPGTPTVVNLPFSQDFEGGTENESVAITGWTNQDVSGSGREWETRTFGGNKYAQLTAYKSSSAVETWLVTPGLDLTSVSQAVLTFETLDGFYNGDALSVYVSTDFTGDASTATWTKLNNVTLAKGDENNYATSFTSSGDVDLSAYLGKVVYVGFKYEGSGSGVTTTMEIDNVSVTESAPGGNPGTAMSLPFTEDFSSVTPNEDIAVQGWTNVDVNGDPRVWEGKSYNNNSYAQISAYQASDAVETWLVSPGIDLGSAANPTLNFATNDGHYNGDALTVYVSTDFSGDPAAATWTQLNNVTISSGHDQGYGPGFVASGNVDLSAYAGQVVYVGFKYIGSSTGVTTTIQLDDVSITDGGNGGTDPGTTGTLAFAGGDFENWQDFVGGLNQYGLQSYATEATGAGQNGSTALQITTDPTTTNGNDYVFTALATAGLPSSYSKITFYVKGTSAKSISINLYNTGGSYYKFNLEDVTGDKTVQQSGNNQYTGTIDTGGNWVKITLDLSGISDLNTTNTSDSFLALKIGKEVNYNLQLDNFTIE